MEQVPPTRPLTEADRIQFAEACNSDWNFDWKPDKFQMVTIYDHGDTGQTAIWVNSQDLYQVISFSKAPFGRWVVAGYSDW